MAKRFGIPTREQLRATLANSGSDMPLAELEEIYAEFARRFAEEERLPVVQGSRWLSGYHQLVESFLGQFWRAMKAQGVTQAELARRLGVSRAWVSKALGGDGKNFQLETIAKLATALDVKVSITVETAAPARRAAPSRRKTAPAKRAPAPRRRASAAPAAPPAKPRTAKPGKPKAATPKARKARR